MAEDLTLWERWCLREGHSLTQAECYAWGMVRTCWRDSWDEQIGTTLARYNAAAAYLTGLGREDIPAARTRA